jgi:predicted enzyme related to lactoylglutathione lyase
MAKVLGVGGVFFKTSDVESLKAWYVRVLKFELTEWGGVFFPPLPTGGTVWSPFSADTDHFKPSTAPFMVNYVVDDLAGVLEHVRSEGVEILDEQAMDGMGKFAWIMDPAGTKIELWQPE